jgi:tRNA-dihydrouridine synthase B
MLAVTDIPFRTICRQAGAAMTFTEMVSAAGIARQASSSFRNAIFTDAERPVAIQLVAANADDAATAVRELSRLKPDAFDINCGCPNERICEAGAGANLLDDLPRLGAIVEAAVKATALPLSVKVRVHGSSRRQSVGDIVRTAEESGAACVIVHTRGKNTPYDTPADWSMLASAVAAVRLPVIGNGDVFSSGDAARMLMETGCHAIMIGRGCLGSPWIFSDVIHGRNGALLGNAPATEELQALISNHFALLIQEFGEMRALPRIRKHALWYARFHQGWEKLRHLLFISEDARTTVGHTLDFFATQPRRFDADSQEARTIEAAFRHRVLYWTTDTLRVEG